MVGGLRRLTGTDSKAQLISLFVGAVLLPSIALSVLSFQSVPKQAEVWKLEQLKGAERVLHYIDEDLNRTARARALEAAKRIGLELLLEGRQEPIQSALRAAGLDPHMFSSLHLEASSELRLPKDGAAQSLPGLTGVLKEALDVDLPPESGGEGEESLPVLGADRRTSGVLRFRYACGYVHGTLLREYFSQEFKNPELVVRVTEPDGSVVHETAQTPIERAFEVQRVMTGPSFHGLKLFLRYKDGTIRDEVRRLAVTKIALIGFIDLMLGVGLYLVFSNVRRELLLSKLKSDFVANVSHELKTPLALIRLFSETLELGRVRDDKKLQYYRVINKESQRLTRLINNILDFSRIEAGRREYKFQRGDLARVLDDVLEAYRFQIEQQGFALSCEVSEGLPEIELDAEAVGQAVINLLNNAIKFSRDDKRIEIRLERVQDELRLTVRDYGIGIADDQQRKIFEKFYRAEDSLVHETKGSGLGLSLVRHIIDAHGGRVEVESAPGTGSCFTLTLPITRPQGSPSVAQPLEGRP